MTAWLMNVAFRIHYQGHLTARAFLHSACDTLPTDGSVLACGDHIIGFENKGYDVPAAGTVCPVCNLPVADGSEVVFYIL